MLDLGIYHTMTILRHTSVGLYLGKDEAEVLLPNKYVPEEYQIGDEIEVFVYLDSLERIVATTLKPFITLHTFAFLQVSHMTDDGAFMEIGLEKQLLVPFREMITKMREREYYIIYCLLDHQTNRLVGTAKYNKYLSNQLLSVKKFEEVDILVSHISDIGVNVIVNDEHKGLIYHSDLFEELQVGDRRKGTVKLVRPENKLDISLTPIGFKNIEPNAEIILQQLSANKNFLALNDDSPPEEIHRLLKMSKKNFKKALGLLYKKRMIEFKDDGIFLVNESK